MLKKVEDRKEILYMRADMRKPDEIRPVKITRNLLKNAHGSVLIEVGDTKVICTAMAEAGTPLFLKEEKKGWITAEYAMLPASTLTRKKRDSAKGKLDGRSVEIQRLIGRSLRCAVDLTLLGDYTIYIDCDVIQADGGTRTASITGAFVALWDCCEKMVQEGLLSQNPVKYNVAAVSVGILDKEPILDLCYLEDSKAEVDMNVIMTSDGRYVEVQGTGEEAPFAEEELSQLLLLAKKGIRQLIELQNAVLQRKEE